MTLIGYHCSHERYAPSELLKLVQLAEQSGFQAGMCSDHYFPWSESQGHSGFAWSWLGAALQATNLSFGMVCAPGQRYNPAIIAQASATLAQMFPDRLWCSFGTGQYLNEHITGEVWPDKKDRMARLEEAAEVIRALWAGETVSHRGRFVVNEAKVYDRPETPPLMLGAAISEETAEWVGSWADGIITIAKPKEDQQRFIDAFYRGGGEGKPMFLQALTGYHPDHETLLEQAWQESRTMMNSNIVQADLKLPVHYDGAATHIRKEDVANTLRLSSNIDDHIKWLQDDISLGFERIFLYNAASDQSVMIRTFGERVLPALELTGVHS